MCLSTVFQVVDGQPEEVCSQVSSAKTEDGYVRFTDIMGVETDVPGTIQSVDLVENKIYVVA